MKNVFLVTYCLLIILFCNSESSFGQSKIIKKADHVKIVDNTGKGIEFIFKSKPKFEIINGVMNISILSEKNTLLEINGINEKALKDTSLTEQSFKVIYIASQNEKAYISNSSSSMSILNIMCSKGKKGNPIVITFTGNLYAGEKMLSFDAKLSGQIPEKKSVTTRKIN